MKKKVLGILVTSAIVGTMLMGCGSGQQRDHNSRSRSCC